VSASPSIAPNPTPDGTEPFAYLDFQSHGTVTIAFSRPQLPSIDFDLVCEWSAPTEAVYFYIKPSPTTFGGESLSFDIAPRSPHHEFVIWRDGAASYLPSVGGVALSRVGDGWANGSMWFEGPRPDPRPGPGLLEMPIEEWLRPIGGDPALQALSGTVSWAREPPPPTLPEPEPQGSFEPDPTFPPFPQLTLASGDVRRASVLGCGVTIAIGEFSGGDSCGPSFQALSVDHIVRVPAGGNLRFQLPADWHFVHWSLGWVSQLEAERWHGEQPASFESIDRDEAAAGRILDLTAPPVGDWAVVLNWMGASGEDSFGAPSYFRVLVE